MTDTVMAATLVAPFDLRVRAVPDAHRPRAGCGPGQDAGVGICGTDKHTYRGETEQYAGTDHASSTPFPIIQGHENVGVVAAIGAGGATAFDGSALAVGDRIVPAPNRACGTCRFCREDFPYYFCRNLENYGNSLSCRAAPSVRRVRRVPLSPPQHAGLQGARRAARRRGGADRAVRRHPQPRPRRADAAPAGFRPGDSVAVVGAGPVGLVHAAKAALLGAGQVIAIDRFSARLDIAADLGATTASWPPRTRPRPRCGQRLVPGGVDVVVDATGHPTASVPR